MITPKSPVMDDFKDGYKVKTGCDSKAHVEATPSHGRLNRQKIKTSQRQKQKTGRKSHIPTPGTPTPKIKNTPRRTDKALEGTKESQ